MFTTFGGHVAFTPTPNNGGQFALNTAAFFTTPTAVPEPGTGALVGLGLAGLVLRRRRRGQPAAQ